MNLPFHSFSGGNREEPAKLDAKELTKVLEIQSTKEALAEPAARSDLDEIIMLKESSGSDESANEQLDGNGDDDDDDDERKGSGLEMDERDDDPMSLTDLLSGFQRCCSQLPLNKTSKAKQVGKSQESNGLLQVKPFDYGAAMKELRFGEDAEVEESTGKEGRRGGGLSKKRILGGKGRGVKGEDRAGDYPQARRRQAFPATGNRSATFRKVG